MSNTKIYTPLHNLVSSPKTPPPAPDRRGASLLLICIAALAWGCDRDSFNPLGGNANSSAVPCSQVRGLFFEDAERGWLGCGGSSGGGVYRTSDAGRSWTAASELPGAPSSIMGQSSRFNAFAKGDDGVVYACGGNNNVSPKIFLYAIRDSQWELLLDRDILLEGGGLGFADCQDIDVSGQNIIVNDSVGPRYAVSEDGGMSWTKRELKYIDSLQIEAGRAYGAGGTIGSGPSFFRGGQEDPLELSEIPAANPLNERQEARALASPDEGASWLLAGAAAGTGGAWALKSANQGEDWSESDIDAGEVSFFEDMTCNGSWCLLVGRLFPDDNGVVFESTDGGDSWRQLPLGDELGPLFTVAITGDRGWASGDGGEILRFQRP